MAGTVSAAALMLGASQGATVGFNFQANYCYAAAYSGAVVTASAFGVGRDNWANLTPMDTGYGCTPPPASYYYYLGETFSVGSGVTVSWSAYTANVSGFGGYDRSPPHYSFFPGNDYRPGNEQVYWGFLRDGVNFGPDPMTGGPSGGDNDQPGYMIDISGLENLFPGTPFAVELIASSDSMQYLAGASIKDVTHNVVKSVSYPSTPPVLDVGDTPWVRGIGGGLSTATDALNTDHLQIIGDRATHGGDKTKGTGYNFASTIAGFIITDAPVISMSPQSVTAYPGDTVTLSGYAVGVPPLSYQWYKNGAPIQGANQASYTFGAKPKDAGSYTLGVSNQYGNAISDPSVVTLGLPAGKGHKPTTVISNPYLM